MASVIEWLEDCDGKYEQGIWGFTEMCRERGGLILWSNIGTGFKYQVKKFTRPGYKVKTRFTRSSH